MKQQAAKYQHSRNLKPNWLKKSKRLIHQNMEVTLSRHQTARSVPEWGISIFRVTVVNELVMLCFLIASLLCASLGQETGAWALPFPDIMGFSANINFTIPDVPLLCSSLLGKCQYRMLEMPNSARRQEFLKFDTVSFYWNSVLTKTGRNYQAWVYESEISECSYALVNVTCSHWNANGNILRSECLTTSLNVSFAANYTWEFFDAGNYAFLPLTLMIDSNETGINITSTTDVFSPPPSNSFDLPDECKKLHDKLIPEEYSEYFVNEQD